MTDKKTVCSDLIGRLESQLPNTVITEKDGRIEIKKILAGNIPLEEATDPATKPYPPIDLGPPPGKPEETSGDTTVEDIDPTTEGPKYYTQLQEIVDEFNEKLDLWYEDTGCVVNFSWGYSGGKKLEIAGIDYIVYRKPAPAPETIKSALAKAKH